MPLTARPRRSARILSQEAEGTMVLLSLDSGHYYSLDEVGGRLWSLCDGQRMVSEIASIIASEYNAPAETITRDLAELLAELTHENLVEENAKKVDGGKAAS